MFFFYNGDIPKPNTLSMLAALRRIMEACARRSNTVLIAFLEYASCGLNNSSINLLFNIVDKMSCITKKNKTKEVYRYCDETLRVQSLFS